MHPLYVNGALRCGLAQVVRDAYGVAMKRGALMIIAMEHFQKLADALRMRVTPVAPVMTMVADVRDEDDDR